MNYVCSICGKTESVHTTKPSCDCGGLWQLDFTPPPFSLELVDKNTWGLFRYRKFMPLLDDSWQQLTLGEGMTPVIQYSPDLLLKMDYYMPTLSFKDRGAVVLMAHCKAIGVKAVVQDSSGNAGNSIAAYAARANIDCDIYVPEGTSPQKINMIKSHKANVHVIEGSRDHCADVCREAVASKHKYYANHVYNPFFYQGTKTYIYEIYEQLGRIPQNIFIPLGNGTLFIGVIKTLEEFMACGIIAKMPTVFGVQSENCCPFFTAATAKQSTTAPLTPTSTLAEGIAIGKPMRDQLILDYIYKYNLPIILAPEAGILPARAELAAKGIYCEHTTAATYAAYKAYIEKNGPLPDSIIPMCGAGLKSDH